MTAIRVTAAGGRSYTIVANPAKRDAVVTLPDGSAWRVDVAFASR